MANVYGETRNQRDKYNSFSMHQQFNNKQEAVDRSDYQAMGIVKQATASFEITQSICNAIKLERNKARVEPDTRRNIEATEREEIETSN